MVLTLTPSSKIPFRAVTLEIVESVVAGSSFALLGQGAYVVRNCTLQNIFEGRYISKLVNCERRLLMQYNGLLIDSDVLKSSFEIFRNGECIPRHISGAAQLKSLSEQRMVESGWHRTLRVKNVVNFELHLPSLSPYSYDVVLVVIDTLP